MINQRATDPSGERFLRYLDEEIKWIQMDLQRPGWTKWALLGTLATTIWLFLDQLEKSVYSYQIICLVLLIASLFYEALCYSHLLSGSSADSVAYRGFRFTNYVFAPMRAALFLLWIRYALTLYFALNSPATFTLVQGTFVLMLLVPATLLMTLGMVFSWVKLPMNVPEQHDWKGRVYDVFVTTAGVYAGINYVLFLFRPGNSPTYADLRIAGLVIVIWYLLLSLAQLSAGSPLLSSLIATRRDYLLGNLSLDAATRQVNIAIAGLKVADLFQEDIKSILSLVESVNVETHYYMRRLEVLQKLSSESIGSLSSEQLPVARREYEAYNNSIAKVDKLLDRIMPLYQSLSLRAMIVKRWVKTSIDDLNDLDQQIKTSLQEAKTLNKTALSTSKLIRPEILEQLRQGDLSDLAAPLPKRTGVAQFLNLPSILKRRTHDLSKHE